MTDPVRFAKTETVMQIEAAECGAASLTMVLRYFGQQVSLDQIRAETDVSRDGCNAGNICRAAEARGLKSRGYRADAEKLLILQPPCIIWWDQNHFVVYEGYRKGEFCINDPAYGKRRLKEDVFRAGYSGIALIFEPTEGFRDAKEFRQSPDSFAGSGRLNALLGGDRAKAAVICTAAAASGASGAAAALLIGNACSKASSAAAAAAAGLLVLMLALDWWGGRQKDRLTDAVELKASHAFLLKLFAMPSAFFEQRNPSDMVARVQSNDRLSRFAAGDLLDGISAAAAALICVIMLTAVFPAAGLAAAAAVAAGIAVKILEYRGCAHRRAEAAVEASRMARTLYTGMCRMEAIINTGCGASYAEKAAASYNRFSADEKYIRDRHRLFSAARIMIYGLCAGLTVWLCSRDSTGPGTVITVFILLCMVLLRTEKTAEIWQHRDRVREDRHIVEDTESYSENPQAKADRQTDAFKKLQGNIRLRDVTFGYQRFAPPIIRDLDLDIPSGSIVGITGSTGSGKSTVGRLLSGMRIPSDGEITYDGRSLREIPRQVITASIATVPQKPVLFSGTVRENITMWNDNISGEAVDRAAEDACIREIILRRRGGYEYRIGERGSGFSGGEQQRIEIARALAADPSVLILDEGSSGLDDQTAARVIDNIRKRGCTMIFITQKQKILDLCDKVIDLDLTGGETA